MLVEFLFVSIISCLRWESTLILQCVTIKKLHFNIFTKKERKKVKFQNLLSYYPQDKSFDSIQGCKHKARLMRHTGILDIVRGNEALG